MIENATYWRKLDRVLGRMGGVYSWRDVHDKLDSGDMQAFAEGNSMLVTQINCYPRAKALDFVLAVGDMKDWRALHDRAVAFADEHNIAVLRAHGRRGWLPHIRDIGWRPVSTSYLYVKEL